MLWKLVSTIASLGVLTKNCLVAHPKPQLKAGASLSVSILTAGGEKGTKNSPQGTPWKMDQSRLVSFAMSLLLLLGGNNSSVVAQLAVRI